MRLAWIGWVFVAAMVVHAPAAVGLPKGAFMCVGEIAIEFAPPLGVIDGWGTASLSPASGACAGASPACFPDDPCLCPAESLPLCVLAGLVGEGGPEVMDYFGSCARAYVDGGWTQIVGGTPVSGALVFGEVPDVGVLSVDGALVAEGGNPCAMARGVCECALTMLFQTIG